MAVIGRASGETTCNYLFLAAATGLTCQSSPDPVLTGIQIAQTIQGIQSSGVIACAKHLIGNEQEHFRQSSEAANFGFKINEALSSNIDDVTMHELYLW